MLHNTQLPSTTRETFLLTVLTILVYKWVVKYSISYRLVKNSDSSAIKRFHVTNAER